MRTVSSLEQLVLLPRDRRVNGFGQRTPLRLDIPDVARHAQVHAEHALNHLQSRCGCLAGGLVTLATLCIGLAMLLDRGLTWSWRLPAQLILLLATAFVLGLIAKLLALAITRWQFAHACRTQYLALIRTAPAPSARE